MHTFKKPLEIESATNFLVHLIRLGKPTISEYQLCKFKNALNELLCSKYYTYWWPEKPLKGSSYRCIHIDKTVNPLILQAGQICGLSAQFLYNTFPEQLTIWIDPHEVSYRINHSSICVLYEYKEGVFEPWHPLFKKKTNLLKNTYFLKNFSVFKKLIHFLMNFILKP